MPRYIDAEALYNKLYPLDCVDKKTYAINAKAVAYAIDNTPTADVVPRAEVELERLNAQSWEELYRADVKELSDNLSRVIEELESAKADIAREIFDEIEKIIDKRYNQHIFGCNDLDDEEHEAIINFSDDISGDIEELKEKYTEGGDEG